MAMAEISLTRGYVALVDDEDQERLARFKWYASDRRARNVYAVRTVSNPAPGQPSRIYMHRQVMTASLGQFVDHKNGDALDNRKSNLRFCSSTQNTHNRRKSASRLTSSRWKGVTWNRQFGKWKACIKIKGRDVFTRHFTDELAAATYYDEIARREYGEFACVNFMEINDNAEARISV